MGFDMMTLKINFCSTIFALSSFCNYLRYGFSRRVASCANSSFPKRVIFSSHIKSASNRKAFHRTIKSCVLSVFFYIKIVVAYFANASNKLCWFFWFNQAGTFTRTSVSNTTIVTSKYLKLFLTCRTGQRNFSTTFNFSRRI